jgi:Carboxypeptidase regulatory-like domain
MRCVSFLQRVIAVALFVLISTGTALSQSDRGAIVGTILDSSGGVVQGATIVATGVDTGAVYKTTSTDTGAYRISDMQLGAYNLTVTATGFKTSEQKGVVVQINSIAALDITLQAGDVKETLTVVADAPTVQTETSDIGTVVSTRQIMDLPLAVDSTGQSHLRSPETFVFLTPGTTGPGTSDDSHGIFQAKLAGGQNFGNEVLLDGASTARMDSGSAFDQTAPSVEALQEFKVTTSTVPSEFGRTSGGVESFSTKSGKNAYHGTAFEIFRNEVLDANTWFNNFNGAPRNVDKKNDYGGSFGGPVWIPKLYKGRDKTFFFFSFEQFRQSQGSTSFTTIPTAAQQKGDFSAQLGGTVMVQDPNNPNNKIPLINQCDGSNVLQGQIFDPTTTKTVNGQTCRTAFPGNKITNINSIAQNILALLPAPNSTNASGNFTFSSTNPVLDTAISGRLDESLSDKNKLFFAVSRRDQESLNGTPGLPTPLDGSFQHPFITDYYRVGWDYFVRPTLLNHLNVGLNRIYNNNVSTSVNGTDWPAKLGITGAHGVVFPPMQFNGGTINYSGFSSNQFDANFVSSLVFADSISWTRGRHSIRIGFDWRSFQYSLRDFSHESPNISFSQGQTGFTPGQGNVTGDPFASFLIAAPQEVSLAVIATQPRFVQNYYAGYVQDDFKVRRNLMLNIGLRYDVETPRHEAHNFQSVFDPTASNPGASGVSGALIFGSSAIGAKTYRKDFAPRLGFAYAPENLFGLLGKTVLRGGYGIFYAGLTYGDFGQSLIDGDKASADFKAADNYTPAFFLNAGIPSFPLPPNRKADQLNGQGGGSFGGITYVAPGYGRPGMVQNWSLEVERQLAPDLILSVGYVGTHATRLRSSVAEINNLDPKFFSLGASLNQAINSATATTLGINPPFPQFETLYGPGTIAQALRPFPQYQTINTDCCLENLGQSTYNALLTKVERRFHNGFNLLASYTFSKTLTDADSAMPIFASFSSGIQNSRNLNQEKSLSIQDIPHTFVVSYIYELPFGKGKKLLNHGVAEKVVGGWQIGGVQRYQSGQPTIFGCQGGLIPGYDGCIRYDYVAGQPFLSPNASSFDLASAIKNGKTGCKPDPSRPGFFVPESSNTYFNCAAFFDQNFAPKNGQPGGYSFGNMPRITAAVRSQAYFNEDFSLIKRTSIFESHMLILKVELPNAFNRHTFTRPDTGITSNTFGTSFGTINPQRTLQLSLRYEF